MTTPRELVEQFYVEVWNRADERLVREILSPDFRFRGSLGQTRTGADSFIDYMRGVHRALGHYRCIIDELLVEGDRAAARMHFTGVHREVFQGVAATGRQVTWAGAAFFALAEGRIAELWVLGDLEDLRRQLDA